MQVAKMLACSYEYNNILKHISQFCPQLNVLLIVVIADHQYYRCEKLYFTLHYNMIIRLLHFEF